MIINDPRKEKESSSIWRAPFYPACRILCGLSLSRQSKMHRIPHVHQDFFLQEEEPIFIDFRVRPPYKSFMRGILYEK